MPTTLGTSTNPLKDISPMGLAMAIMQDEFASQGARTVYRVGYNWWVWTSNLWTVTADNEVEDRVWKWLSGAFKFAATPDGTAGAAPLKYDSTLISTVMRCLEAVTRVSNRTPIPCWMGSDRQVDPNYVIAFRNCLVDIKASVAAGQVVTIERGREWFDMVTVPCDYDPAAVCPTFSRCVSEWGGGDAAWALLLQREMGYTQMATRTYAKWFMHYGMARGGKGTIEAVRRRLIGESGYMGLRMSSLSKNFGLHRLSSARLVAISEVTGLEKDAGNQAGGLIKNILGRDPIDLDKKHQDPMENVVVNAAVVMLGNELPTLPNSGGGLSSKMVPLDFQHSWVGREDFELGEKLGAEVQGIGRWVVEGAISLVAEGDSRKKFPLTEGAREALEKFVQLANPADGFLAWAFEKRDGGFVSSELVWGRYMEFTAQMRVKPVARTQFNNWLEVNNSWRVYKHRLPQGGLTGFKGLSYREQTGWLEGSGV